MHFLEVDKVQSCLFKSTPPVTSCPKGTICADFSDSIQIVVQSNAL